MRNGTNGAICLTDKTYYQVKIKMWEKYFLVLALLITAL